MTEPLRRDGRGLPVGTASQAALAHAERALWRMVSFFDAPLDDLAAASAEDPGWMLPHLMHAGFLLTLTEPSLAPQVQTALQRAEACDATAPAREKAHLAALRRCATGDWAGACQLWDEILNIHPQDLCALQWAHLFDFYLGDAGALCRRPQRVLPAWPQEDPLRPYVLGLLAFGLEECGRCDEAEATGREAVSGAAQVPWATHAVAHVMEMQGRPADGAAWLQARRAVWAEGNGFALHHWWHLGLFHLEGLDTAAALALYDEQLNASQAQITLNRLDGVALLWRLRLLGVEAAPQWQDAVEGWDWSAEAAGHSVFNDVHAQLALLGAGRGREAADWLNIVRAKASSGLARELGLPLMTGLQAHAQGDAATAWRQLAPLLGTLHRIGGSHAQRDLVTQTVLAAALSEAGRDAEAHALAQRLLGERSAARRSTPLAEHWLAQLPTRATSQNRPVLTPRA